MFFSRVPSITPEELHSQWEAGAEFVLLDVREPREIAAAAFPMPAVTIPVQQLPARLSELAKDAEIVCVCHSGGRSAAATKLLLANGFTKVKNLEGGISGWARRFGVSGRGR